MIPRWFQAAALLVTISTAAGPAQNYSGPRPPKPDIPYLMHADNQIETEVIQANEEDRGKETLAWVPGASSAVRTPLAEPIFLIEAREIVPEKLELYRFEVRRGRREIVMPKNPGKNARRPLRISVSRLAERLYRVEASQALENGEYTLTPSGSSQAFCFQVY
jgi:hypothetical protein